MTQALDSERENKAKQFEQISSELVSLQSLSDEYYVKLSFLSFPFIDPLFVG